MEFVVLDIHVIQHKKFQNLVVKFKTLEISASI